jgi:26S proteasome regulatory subunit N2
MAYAGTGNNKAIRRLLHVAVSDVNDDVRRAAVMSLGFVLFRTPKQVPRVVQLLAESYNPHVRYGATMALAFSCAGSGSPEALELIEPMIKDPVDYVRQGALIAMAMVLMQQNEATSPKVASTRKLYEKIIGDKHEDSMSKFGATIGQGIIDAGGRNVTISLATRSGLPNMSAIVGAVMFSQFWYWFPLSLFLSLSFTPTAYIGLNVDLKIPEMEIISNSKPSTFAYPSPTKPPTVEKVEKVATAVLSTTAKAKQRAKKSEKEKEEKDAIDTDEKKPEVAAGEDKMEEDKKEEEGETKEEGAEDKESKKKAEEPNFDIIPNVSRLLQQQLPLVTFKDDSRYTPIKKVGLAFSFIEMCLVRMN